jgi:uncharacterized RDD family membrane protein YckC
MDDSLLKQTASPALPPWPVSPGPTITLAPVPPKITSAAVREYAGFWRRFAASFIDGIIVWFIFFIVRAFISAIGLGQYLNPLIGRDSDRSIVSWGGIPTETALTLVIGMIYFGYQESSVWQATLGKRALGIIVTDLDGDRITPIRAIKRHIASILSTWIFFLGYLIQPFTRRRQALHDVIARTLVLKA